MKEEIPTIGIKDFFSRISKGKLFLLLLVTLINSFVGLTFAFITNWAQKMSAKSSNQEILMFILKGLVLYLAIHSALYASEILINAIVKEASISLANDCMSRYLNTSALSEKEITSLITQDLRELRESYYIPLVALPSYVIRAGTPIIYLLTQNVVVGICFTVGALLMLLPQRFMGKALAQLGEDFSKSREETMAVLVDNAKGKKTIVHNEATSSFLMRFTDSFVATEEVEYHLHNKNALLFNLAGPIKGLADVLPFAVGIYLMRFDPRITIVLLLAMLATAGTLKSNFQQIIYLRGDILETPKIRQKFGAVLAQKEKPAEVQLTTPFDFLAVSHINKRYGEKIIFEEVNLQIFKNEKVLLIGESGIGKSTFFNLLMGEEEPDDGKIYLGKGTPENFTHQKTNLSSKIALIHQKPYLFNLTVEENITLGKVVPKEKLLQILEKVQLLDQLGTEPLSFKIENNGENLSGGQQVKIEIARALLNDKEILLVDEVTANLDQENAKMIRNLILTLPCTVIEIAHHYDDTTIYDQILKIQNHQIISLSSESDFVPK